MGRILAIDYGTARVGIAVSDPLGLIAGALDTVPTAGLMRWLEEYLSREAVERIVIGMPRRMNGEPSESFRHIEPFAARLRARFPDMEVVYFDERFTSVLAHRAIIEGGVPRMARRDKGLADRVSATIILQGYMESRKNQI